MKIIPALLLFLFIASITNGQTSEKFKFPVVKESKVIDSLIEYFLTHPSKIREGKYKREPSKDKLMEIVISKADDDYLRFYISTSKSLKNFNVLINQITSHNINYSFFYHKQFKVFVRDADSHPGFFSKSNKLKTVDSIHKMKVTVEDLDMDELAYNSEFYLYKQDQGFKLDRFVLQ